MNELELIRLLTSSLPGNESVVNGAGDGLVELRFDPPMRAHVLGLPVTVRRLRIAVDDPTGLVEAIGARAGG